MKTRQAAITLCVGVLLGFVVASAEEVQTPPAEVDGSNSVLTLTRDPFWPVGWEPPVPGKVSANTTVENVPTKWDEARALLQLTGLSKSLNGKYLAILKGIGVVEEGETVSVHLKGLNYKWKITSITSKGIVPERMGVYPIK